MFCVTCLVICQCVLGTVTHCAVGKYRNMENIATSSAVRCDMCPSGYFQPKKGEGYYNPTICTECPVGYFSGQGWSNCGDQCPPGSKQVEATKTCESCALGKYQGIAGQTSCSICPGGKFSNTYDCEICPSGKFSKPGAAICTSCPGHDWSLPESDHCEACTWCLPGACMPKAENKYCEECTWGKTQVSSILTLNRKQFEEGNYKDELAVNSIYDKDTVMFESCNACCLRQSLSCINKGVTADVLTTTAINVEGSKQLDAISKGMCSFWLEDRSCTTNPRTLKQTCTTELQLQQLVSAAPAISVSWSALVGLGLLMLCSSRSELFI